MVQQRSSLALLVIEHQTNEDVVAAVNHFGELDEASSMHCPQ